MFELERFVDAQDATGAWSTAMTEIKNGKKRSHWIWYVFPQMAGLGRSPMSRRYAIGSLLEARAYCDNPILLKRLNEAAGALYDYGGESMNEILGETDAMKVLSSMTLFDYVERDSIFHHVLRDCFNGERCRKTKERMDREFEWIRQSAFVRNGLRTDEKALFEGGSFESEQYSSVQLLGTFLDLYLKGEKMEQMVSHYFWSRDCSDYRADNVESTVKFFISDFLANAWEYAREYPQKRALYMYEARLENVGDPLRAASEFDIIFNELTRNPLYESLLNEYLEKSLLAK